MYIKQQFSVCLHYFISFVSWFEFPSVNVESECVSVCEFFFLLSFLTFFLRLYSLRCLNIFYFSLLLQSTIFISSYFYCVFIWLFCFFFCLFSYYAILLLFFETGHQNNWLLQNVFLPVALSAFIHELESVDFT